MTRFGLLAVTLAFSCSGDKGADTADSSADTDTDTDTDTDSDSDTDTDTDTAFACDTTNEDCAPHTCGGDGPRMLPGADCLACHSSGSGEREAPPWSFGGTIFTDLGGSAAAGNVTIRVTDANGNVVELTSNSVGNFYSNQSITFPINAEVEKDGVVLSMASAVGVGGCNSCHACDGEAGGKLYAP